MKLSLITILGIFMLLCGCSRKDEFRARAIAGQPIVGAIEKYHSDTGSYPESLSALVPNYLGALPETPDPSARRYIGWDYTRTTNGRVGSFSLRYYMGRGGVEYESPDWIGIDEGHRIVLLSNK